MDSVPTSRAPHHPGGQSRAAHRWSDLPPGGSGFTLSPFASAANTHRGDLQRLTRLIPDPIWPVTLMPSPWSNPREGHPTPTPRPEEGTSVISPRVTLSGRWPAGLWPASAEQGWCPLHATAVAPGASGVPTAVMVAQGRLSVMATPHLPCPPPPWDHSWAGRPRQSCMGRPWAQGLGLVGGDCLSPLPALPGKKMALGEAGVTRQP